MVRTITVNGVAFSWKLRESAAKSLGIKGPGDSAGKIALIESMSADWAEARRAVLAGAKSEDHERLSAAMDDWDEENWGSFFMQMFNGGKDPNENQPSPSGSGSDGSTPSQLPATTSV